MRFCASEQYQFICYDKFTSPTEQAGSAIPAQQRLTSVHPFLQPNKTSSTDHFSTHTN